MDIDKILIILLKNAAKKKIKLSTYELAKKSGVSWSTVRLHCYKIKTDKTKNLTNEVVKLNKGNGTKTLWWIR